MTRLVGLENELRGKHPYHDIVGQSRPMQEIYGLIDALADMDTTVLITGKSGTGKELVAKAIHDGGIRASKPFVTVNCSALAENLLESELFGHVKGAFTGAFRDKQGRFQMADGGTILLDEIGDISPMIQLKLLRVLQESPSNGWGLRPSKGGCTVIAAPTGFEGKGGAGGVPGGQLLSPEGVEIALPPCRSVWRTCLSWWNTSACCSTSGFKRTSRRSPPRS
jgi:DNA-binding NtrC family response regulator